MKKLGISLVLAIMMSVLGLEQVNMPDQRLSVDQGHYVGRGSVAGEHADELETQKTGFTLHSGISFYKNGLVEGSLKTQAALYGYDVYRLVWNISSINRGVSIRYVYDSRGDKGWLTLHKRWGENGNNAQESKNQFSGMKTIVYSGKEAKEWQDFCKTEFPKIWTEGMKDSDGPFAVEYLIDGQYERIQIAYPDREESPTFLKVIKKMTEPLAEPLEFLRDYVYWEGKQ